MLEKESYKKLLPLRKFAKSDGYSAAYLSQLVQRKKLKAVKIGRNYFTCQEWFDGYLERHARDNKQSNYDAAAPEKSGSGDNLAVSSKLALNDKKANFFVLPESFNEQIKIKSNQPRASKIAVIAAIFVFLAINIYYLSNLDNRGQVAGTSEGSQAATEIYGIHASSTDAIK